MILFHGKFPFLLLLPACWLAAGCTSSAPRPLSDSAFQQQQKDLQAAEHSLAQHQNEDGIHRLQAIISSGLDERLFVQGNLDLGHAYEEVFKYKEAAEVYERLSQFLEGTPSAQQAETLHRLSLCYEALNQDEKMLLTLLELDSEQDVLGPQIGQVELPARIAGAYARAGNFEEAQKYMERARQGLRRFRRKKLSSDDTIWLPKTYYSMGHVSLPRDDFSVDEFNHYVDGLEQTQGYLLRAAERQQSDFGVKALLELKQIYGGLIKRVDSITAPLDADNDPAIRQQLTQGLRKTLAVKLDSIIHKLYLERLPDSPNEPEPQPLTDFFKDMAHLSQRVDAVISGREVRDSIVSGASPAASTKVKTSTGRKAPVQRITPQ